MKKKEFELLSVHNVPAGCLAFAIALVVFGQNVVGGIAFVGVGIVIFLIDRGSEIWIRKYEADKRDSAQTKKLTAAQITAHSKQTNLAVEDKRTERAKLNHGLGFLRDLIKYK